MDEQTESRTIRVPSRAAALIEAELEAASGAWSVGAQLAMRYAVSIAFMLAAFAPIVDPGAFQSDDPRFEFWAKTCLFVISLGAGVWAFVYTRTYSRGLAARGLHPWRRADAKTRSL